MSYVCLLLFGDEARLHILYRADLEYPHIVRM